MELLVFEFSVRVGYVCILSGTFQFIGYWESGEWLDTMIVKIYNFTQMRDCFYLFISEECYELSVEEASDEVED